MGMVTWKKQQVVQLINGAPDIQYQANNDVNKVIICNQLKKVTTELNFS